MEATYYTKSNYGHAQMYIIEPHIAQALRIISGRTTMTGKDKEMLESVGLTFTEVLKPKS